MPVQARTTSERSYPRNQHTTSHNRSGKPGAVFLCLISKGQASLSSGNRVQQIVRDARIAHPVRGRFVEYHLGQPDVTILHHTGSELITSELKELSGARHCRWPQLCCDSDDRITSTPGLPRSAIRSTSSRTTLPSRDRCSVPRASTPGSRHRRCRAPGTGAVPPSVRERSRGSSAG